MDIFIYIMIFIMGTVFGSFFSLAIYRIPRKENITYVQSHCVSCNHKLGPKDLIPILSYIFLGGKCRYCKEKIRNRYIMLEVISGLTFLLIAIFLKINVFSTILEFINLFILYLFLVSVFIIGGIDKENNFIPDSVILYSIVVCILHLLLNGYMGIECADNIMGFLFIPVILLIYSLFNKTNKSFINLYNIKYLSVIGLFLGFKLQLIIFIFSLVFSFVGNLIHKFKQIPFAYYISIATVLSMIFGNPLLEIIKQVSVF